MARYTIDTSDTRTLQKIAESLRADGVAIDHFHCVSEGYVFHFSVEDGDILNETRDIDNDVRADEWDSVSADE